MLCGVPAAACRAHFHGGRDAHQLPQGGHEDQGVLPVLQVSQGEEDALRVVLHYIIWYNKMSWLVVR